MLQRKNTAIQPLALKTSAPDSGIIVYAKQNDANSRILRVEIRNAMGRVPIDGTVQLNAQKPDGTFSYLGGRVTDDGLVEFTLTSQLLAIEGEVHCDVSIFAMNPNTEIVTGNGSNTVFTMSSAFYSIDKVEINGVENTNYTYNNSTFQITFGSTPANGAVIAISGMGSAVLTTQAFIIQVGKTIYDEGAIESSNEFSTITVALSTMHEISEQARAWAVGTEDTEAEQYQNNAKYYKEFIEDYAEAFSVFEVYNPSKQYVEGNKVSHNGSSYYCIEDSLGNAPTNTTYWLLIAEKGAQGEQGEQGPQGEQGEKGDDGHTPVKGTDYWTEADKGEIIQAVVDVMGGSLIGYVDENNVIVLVGGLEGETYTVKYKMEDESLIDIGELVLSEPEEPEEVINQIPISTDASGEPFNGGQGWKTGYRMSMSSGSETAAEGYECTGFIPVAYGDVIRIKGVDLREENSTNMVFYDSDKVVLKTSGGTNIGTTLYHLFITKGTEETGGVHKTTLNASTFSNLNSDMDLAYIRFGSREITDESIFTVNQEITYERHSVTNNLTNCVNSNDSTEVVTGDSYSATISANSGYTISSITVTMGGVDITSTAVSGGNINIASVTGDIVITAVAEAEVVKTNFFKATPTVDTMATAPQDAMILGGRIGSDMGYRVDGGHDCLMSNYIPIQNGDEVYVTNLEIYPNLNSGLFANIGDTKATAVFDSSNGNGNVTNVSANGFTISNASVSYVRITGKPSNSIMVNASGTTVSERYDCSQIIINVKRNGAWL